MTTAARTGRRRSRLSVATAVAMAGLTGAFAWILLIDLRLYGVLPDDSLLPIQLLLLAATCVAAAPWRWGPAVAALVAVAAGVGSAVQPITMTRLTTPETPGLLVATVLVLVFASAAAVAGTAHTVRELRTREE